MLMLPSMWLSRLCVAHRAGSLVQPGVVDIDPGGPPPVARLSATTTNGPLQRTLTEMERRQRELAVDRDGSTQEVDDSDSSVSSLQGASQSQSYFADSVFDAFVVRFPQHPPCLLDTVPVYNLLAQVHNFESALLPSPTCVQAALPLYLT